MFDGKAVLLDFCVGIAQFVVHLTVEPIGLPFLLQVPFERIGGFFADRQPICIFHLGRSGLYLLEFLKYLPMGHIVFQLQPGVIAGIDKPVVGIAVALVGPHVLLRVNWPFSKIAVRARRTASP